MDSEETNKTESIPNADTSSTADALSEAAQAQLGRGVKRGESKRIERIRRAINGGDIRFRGPLSYRHLRIVAWVFLALASCSLILTLASFIAPFYNDRLKTASNMLSAFRSLSVPLFMLANFSRILNAQNGYKRLFTVYALSAAALASAFILLTERYAIGFLSLFTGSANENMETVLTGVFGFSGNGYIAFNIFVDLLLCLLLMFFVSYRPKRFLTGRRRFIFRLGALIPIAYEAASIVLKVRAGMGVIKLPIYVWPFLTSKPPVVFLVFLALTLFVKNRERSLRKKGFTHEEFKRYLKTNRNSLNFSLYTFSLLVIAAVFDFIVYMILPAFIAVGFYGSNSAETAQQIYTVLLNVGVGGGLCFLLLAPITLLFSYTRTHKNDRIDLLIPAFGVVFTVIVVIEFTYQLLLYAPRL